MAWARKLPSGRYQSQIRDKNGRTINPFPGETFTQKAEAVRRGGEEEVKRARPLHRDEHAAEMTWSQWCDEHWWPNRHRQEPETLRRQASDREAHLRPYWGEWRLADITPMDIDRWIVKQKRKVSDRTGRTLSASTVQRHVHLLSASLTYAVKSNVLIVNPAARMDVAPVQKGASGDERFFTRPEADRLIAGFDDEVARFFAKLLLGTGMRLGEGAGLHEARFLSTAIDIQETWTGRGKRMKAYPKGHNQRTVPVAPWLRGEVDDWTKANPPADRCGQTHTGSRCSSGLIVVGGRRGNPINEGWFRKAFLRALENAGLGHARPHDLRHTYASWLLQDGATLEDVQVLLGHESIKVTQRYAKFEKGRTSPIVLASLSTPVGGTNKQDQRAANVQQVPSIEVKRRRTA